MDLSFYSITDTEGEGEGEKHADKVHFNMEEKDMDIVIENALPGE